MRRREFITLIGGAAVAWPLAARAQQPGPVRRIGMLVGGAAVASGKNVAAFRDGLQKLGWTDGRNVRFNDRFGLGAEELRTYAAELVGITPDLILAGNASALVPLQQATRTIPIVFANVPDPLANGFVTSLARPGGNITGFANYEQTIAVKWLELLKQLAPLVTRVAFIIDSTNPAGAGYLHAIEAGASSFGVKVSGAVVHNADEIERIIDPFARTPNTA
jgi:putative ABC transport system substrate-binding protein